MFYFSEPTQYNMDNTRLQDLINEIGTNYSKLRALEIENEKLKEQNKELIEKLTRLKETFSPD